MGDGGSIDRLEFHAGGGRRRNLTEELFEIWYELLLDGLRELQSAGVSNVHFRDFLGISCYNRINNTNKILYIQYIYGDNTGLIYKQISQD